MQIILFDTKSRALLYPFSSTKPFAQLRIGILTIREKWELSLGLKSSVITEDYLKNGYPAPEAGHSLLINSSLIPDEELLTHMKQLRKSEALVQGNKLLAGILTWQRGWTMEDIAVSKFNEIIPYNIPFRQLQGPWQIFQWNKDAINFDFGLLTEGKKSQAIPPGNRIVGADKIFLETGAKLEWASLDASSGPIYIGRDAEIMEGSLIRGPFALGEGGVIKMGSRIYGATTIGPYSVVGGEIKNSVVMAHSNKGHDGYLGDSVIGDWCNIGAGSCISNLKNTASPVFLQGFSGIAGVEIGTKCGLLMGDYGRCAINTSFNTGTVAGCVSNIFGQGFTPKYIPEFTWGYNERYQLNKALEHIANWKKLKGQSLTQQEIDILEHLYKQSN
jgi:UDP-N-acetylglucosamine diphosphorylase/glucosamine-1-phosphate N-acetyltransferase